MRRPQKHLDLHVRFAVWLRRVNMFLSCLVGWSEEFITCLNMSPFDLASVFV